nr:MAG TPA: hypothetical protein [Caudoviricetes sp.]
MKYVKRNEVFIIPIYNGNNKSYYYCIAYRENGKWVMGYGSRSITLVEQWLKEDIIIVD